MKDQKAYERSLRQTYLRPFYDRMRRQLAQAESANQAYRAMGAVVQAQQAMPQAGIPTREIQRALDRMRGYTDDQVKRAFRAALAVDIAPVLAEAPVMAFMGQKISENVALIRTIPERFHLHLKLKMAEWYRDNPFDQASLQRMLAREFKSSGYNLRRITRDQNSKVVAGLARIRHEQCGVDRYQWLTSQDERVRPTHVANSGLTFEYGQPPPETGNPGDDIQCRCVAVPVVTDEMAARLKEITGPASAIDIQVT